jgi:hypothetical protein
MTPEEIEAFDARQAELLKTTLLEDAEDDRGCPCLLTTPCHSQCTCAHPGMSAGCRRCCRYGSVEQRKAMAEHLATILDEASVKAKALRDPIDVELQGIHHRCNRAFITGDFEDITNRLSQIFVEEEYSDILVGWLSATVAAKDQLGTARAHFVARCRPFLVAELGEARVANIYSRLG